MKIAFSVAAVLPVAACWLRRHDRPDKAVSFLTEASRLHPNSWNIWRQSASVNESGFAAGPEFWARVQALGDQPYYPPTELPAF